MDPAFLLWFNAIVYASALYVLGVPPWKAVAIAIIVLIASGLWYGRQWLLRIGFVLMVVGIAVWCEAIPEPRIWPTLLEKLLHKA